MNTMTELYNTDALRPERARKRRALIIMLVLGAIGLAACIIACTFATRRNLRLVMPLTIGISCVTGWTVITILHGAFSEAGAMYKHTDLMLNEPRKTVVGRFEKTDDVRRIKNGVTVRKVRWTGEEHEMILSINEKKAAQLPDAFTGTVQTVYDFIVAYEVNEDA